MDPESYTMGQQHGVHLEFGIAVVDRTREEGGMNNGLLNKFKILWYSKYRYYRVSALITG